MLSDGYHEERKAIGLGRSSSSSTGVANSSCLITRKTSGEPSQFAQLPAELKHMIFACLSSVVDCEAIRLVCKEWRDIVAPILWGELLLVPQDPIPKCESQRQKIEGLFYPRSGILPYVRKLIFKADGTKKPYTAEDEFKVNLVISLLPKNSLWEFRADGPISPRILVPLLQSQRRLKSLEIKLNSEPDIVAKVQASGISFQHCATWMPQCLSEIERLLLWISPPQPQNNANFVPGTYELLINNIVLNSPRLKSLQIGFEGKNERWIADNVVVALLKGNATSTDNEPPKSLESLGLTGVFFAEPQPDLGRYIDFSGVTKLILCECRNIDIFIGALAMRFSQSACALEELHILDKTPWANLSILVAIQDLLNSFFGLHTFMVDLHQYQMLDVATIGRHGETLQCLVIAASDTCPKLKQLSLNLSPLDFGKARELAVNFDINPNPLHFHVKTEFEALLEIVGNHPNLQTFRVSTEPTVDFRRRWQYDDDLDGEIVLHIAYTWRAIKQHYASQVMRILHRYGSKIKVFSTNPFNRMSSCHLNGNWMVFPCCHYIRGTTTSIMGLEQVVAVPLQNWESEMGESTILGGVGYGHLW